MKRVIESGCLILVLLLSSPGYAQRLPEAGSQLERSLVAHQWTQALLKPRVLQQLSSKK